MSLRLHKLHVRKVMLGTNTVLEDGVLMVDHTQLSSLVKSRDGRIANVTLHVASPGEATRILCTKDVVQPRCKSGGDEIGSGATFVLENVAVATCGPIVGFQEGVIDMSGPGANYTPFSALALIVVEIKVKPGTSPHEHETALRSAGLFAAEFIAQHCATLTPHSTEELQWDEVAVDSNLPRIAYVDMVLSQGLLHDTYVLGRNAGEILPLRLDPRVLIDGGIVSGNCVSACDKITTYHHQNNPLIFELMAGHGTRWNFVGAVVTNAPTRLAEKQRCAKRAVELVCELAPDGAVISKEGFGNPDADLMMIIRGLEAAGVKTAAITDEYAGPDGASQSLADSTPEADSLVSVGNANERIVLPAMETIIGPLPDVARIAGGYAHSVREDGTFEIELQAIVGSTNQLGFSRLSCRGI